MANAIEFTPPGAAGTYTTDRRDERAETDPSSPLTLRELSDLRWFFCEAESDMGVHSTFGEQLDRALGQMISDDAALEAKTMARLRSRVRHGWRPKAETAKRYRLNDKAEAMMSHLGVEFPGALSDPDGNFQTRKGLTVEWMRENLADLLSDQTIYMRSPVHSSPPDPYEDDRVLVLVRRANAIRARLRRTGEKHTKVLCAVYGPVVNGESHEAFRKRFGDMVSIVLAVVASRREPGDPSPRSIVRAKLTDDSFVRMMHRVASGYLRAACAAYAETRS